MNFMMGDFQRPQMTLHISILQLQLTAFPVEDEAHENVNICKGFNRCWI